MIDYILYLLRHRIRDKLFTYAWLKLWAKRFVTLPGLFHILYRISRISLMGGTVGGLSVMGKSVDLRGKASLLKIGRGCYIGSRVRLDLHDKITLGDSVVVSDGCVLLTASHDINDPDWKHTKAPILLEDYVWIATNSIIMPGVTIGTGSVVGAGAVVAKSIPAYSIVVGNPARVIKERELKNYTYTVVRFLAPFEAWVGLRDKIDAG